MSRAEAKRPGILFVMWEEIYRLIHWRKWRQHEAYLRAFDAWMDGIGPMPDFRDYYT
jgi:hypothetical protein